jgi:hypothetical protein
MQADQADNDFSFPGKKLKRRDDETRYSAPRRDVIITLLLGLVVSWLWWTAPANPTTCTNDFSNWRPPVGDAARLS